MGQRIVHLRLIKHLQPIPVIVAHIAVQLPDSRQPPVRINGHGEFIIRVGIIKIHLEITGSTDHLLQFSTGKGLHSAGVGISFQPFKKLSHVILPASCPVFQPQPVLDGNDDASARFQMGGNFLQHIDIGIFPADIPL